MQAVFCKSFSQTATDTAQTKRVDTLVNNIAEIKEAIKTNVEENKTDKVEMAKNCREFKTELEKYKAEETKKKEQ